MGNFLFGFTLHHARYIVIRAMNDLVYCREGGRQCCFIIIIMIIIIIIIIIINVFGAFHIVSMLLYFKNLKKKDNCNTILKDLEHERELEMQNLKMIKLTIIKYVSVKLRFKT